MMEIGQLSIGNDRSNMFSGIVEDQFQIIVRFLQLIVQGTIDCVCVKFRKANVERLEETETRSAAFHSVTHAGVHREGRMDLEDPSDEFTSILRFSCPQLFGENIKQLRERERVDETRDDD
jgi:hypothetical protein